MGSSAANTSDPGRLVRPFAVVAGRLETPASGNPPLDLATTVVAARRAGEPDGLHPEREKITWLCTRPRSIAELAGELDLPLSVVRLLVQDLLGAGELRVSGFPVPAQRLDSSVLHRIRDGLRAL